MGPNEAKPLGAQDDVVASKRKSEQVRLEGLAGDGEGCPVEHAQAGDALTIGHGHLHGAMVFQLE